MPTIAFRCDDFGLCESVNRGIADAVCNGVARNISFQANGPAFEHGVALIRDRMPDACVGLDVSLNCEWTSPRFGPLLPRERVADMLEPDGTLPFEPRDFHERKTPIGPMLDETRAQLQRLRDAGVNVQYMDQHMGVGWVNGLGAALRELAQREGLPFVDDRAFLQGPKLKAETDLEDLLLRLLLLTDDEPRLFITHPGCDDDELAGFTLRGEVRGQTARNRNADRWLLTDPRLLALVEAGRLRTVRLA